MIKENEKICDLWFLARDLTGVAFLVWRSGLGMLNVYLFEPNNHLANAFPVGQPYCISRGLAVVLVVFPEQHAVKYGQIRASDIAPKTDEAA